MTTEEYIKQFPYWNAMMSAQEFVATHDHLIEFAKLHVQEALKQAADKAQVVADDRQDFRFQSCNCLDYVIDKDSILNAYSLDNIK